MKVGVLWGWVFWLSAGFGVGSVANGAEPKTVSCKGVGSLGYQYEVSLSFTGSAQAQTETLKGRDAGNYVMKCTQIQQAMGVSGEVVATDTRLLTQERLLSTLEVTDSPDFVRYETQFEAVGGLGSSCRGQLALVLKIAKDPADSSRLTVDHTCYDEAKGYITTREIDLRGISCR